jgi:hypothetical protein
VEEFLGKKMTGWKYKPLLSYFADKKEQMAFTVSTGPFVTLDSGTVRFMLFSVHNYVTALNVTDWKYLGHPTAFNCLG